MRATINIAPYNRTAYEAGTTRMTFDFPVDGAHEVFVVRDAYAANPKEKAGYVMPVRYITDWQRRMMPESLMYELSSEGTGVQGDRVLLLDYVVSARYKPGDTIMLIPEHVYACKGLSTMGRKSIIKAALPMNAKDFYMKTSLGMHIKDEDVAVETRRAAEFGDTPVWITTPAAEAYICTNPACPVEQMHDTLYVKPRQLAAGEGALDVLRARTRRAELIRQGNTDTHYLPCHMIPDENTSPAKTNRTVLLYHVIQEQLSSMLKRSRDKHGTIVRGGKARFLHFKMRKDHPAFQAVLKEAERLVPHQSECLSSHMGTCRATAMQMVFNGTPYEEREDEVHWWYYAGACICNHTPCICKDHYMEAMKGTTVSAWHEFVLVPVEHEPLQEMEVLSITAREYKPGPLYAKVDDRLKMLATGGSR